MHALLALMRDNKRGRLVRLVQMVAAEKGHWEVCLKLAELGADLNKADRVSETCCNCMSVCCCIVVMLTFFFELVWKDGLDGGCCEGTDESE